MCVYASMMFVLDISRMGVRTYDVPGSRPASQLTDGGIYIHACVCSAAALVVRASSLGLNLHVCARADRSHAAPHTHTAYLRTGPGRRDVRTHAHPFCRARRVYACACVRCVERREIDRSTDDSYIDPACAHTRTTHVGVRV